MKYYNDKFSFLAADQSSDASKKVDKYYKEWVDGEPGEIELDKICLIC